MKYYILCLFAAALALAGIAPASRAQNTGLTIHEWGTFTSLQDETGRAIGGINTDDEPVPSFVHDVARMLLISPTEIPPTLSKGVPICHPDITMRLETPVLYLHAPADFHGPFDVRVAFKGGWLTQFYPQAKATTPGGSMDGWVYGHLTGDTFGQLEWLGLRAVPTCDGPATNERVWLAPRAVQASGLQTPEGEAEKFLFYRGVGHLDAPLRVVRTADGGRLDLLPGETPSAGSLPTGKLWLVDIRPDGTLAYRTLGPLAAAGSTNAPLATTSATFAPENYAVGMATSLRTDLRSALVAEGLFADEADALLNTWEVSYFKSPGLRLFFLVPQPWTDRVLPLTVSGVPSITRVMVGRIELVTLRQRELLARVAAGDAADAGALSRAVNAWGQHAENSLLWNELYLGKMTLARAGITVPAAYGSYLELGRFRNALLLDAQRRGESPKLGAFIKAFGLEGYTVPHGIVLAR